LHDTYNEQYFKVAGDYLQYWICYREIYIEQEPRKEQGNAGFIDRCRIARLTGGKQRGLTPPPFDVFADTIVLTPFAITEIIFAGWFNFTMAEIEG
jgi:hypothetical protein